jgi:hypothetical protein
VFCIDLPTETSWLFVGSGRRLPQVLIKRRWIIVSEFIVETCSIGIPERRHLTYSSRMPNPRKPRLFLRERSACIIRLPEWSPGTNGYAFSISKGNGNPPFCQQPVCSVRMPAVCEEIFRILESVQID